MKTIEQTKQFIVDEMMYLKNQSQKAQRTMDLQTNWTKDEEQAKIRLTNKLLHDSLERRIDELKLVIDYINS